MEINLSYIGINAFGMCSKLKKAKMAINSKLQKIDTSSFCCTSIESFSFPAQIISISRDAFFYCKQLKIVEFDENSQIRNITDIFNKCDQLLIMVPAKFIC